MSVYSNSESSTPAERAQYLDAVLDLLGTQDPLAVLRSTTSGIKVFLRAMPAAFINTAEAVGKWSIRDVVQHLADSEMVGGVRVRLILAQDRPTLTAYDQDLWASRLHYDEIDADEALQQFTVLRAANLRLWEQMGPADLARVGLHTERGEQSLTLLRQLYAGHDLLHVRQLERIRAAVLRGYSGDVS